MSASARGSRWSITVAMMAGVVVLAVAGSLLVRSMVNRSTLGAEPEVVAGHVVPGTGHMRTLLVRASNDRVSMMGGSLQAMLMEGTMPAGSMMATVMTDENCDPDGQGVSHCLNRLRFDDGTMISVMHNHRMSDVPCLSPDERVIVQPSA